jgi:hypothetical protein
MRLRPCLVHGLDGSSRSKALSSQGPGPFFFSESDDSTSDATLLGASSRELRGRRSTLPRLRLRANACAEARLTRSKAHVSTCWLCGLGCATTTISTALAVATPPRCRDAPRFLRLAVFRELERLSRIRRVNLSAFVTANQLETKTSFNRSNSFAPPCVRFNKDA